MKKGRVVTNSFLKGDEFRKYFFWAITIVLLILSYLVLRSYLITLVSAFILAYLIRPLHIRLSKKMNRKIAALVSILIVLLVFILPVGLIVGNVVQQIGKYSTSGASASFESFSFDSLEKLGISLESISEISEGFSKYVLSLFTSALAYIPSVLISLIIILFGMYFILMGWDDLSNHLQNYLPFRNKSEVTKDISEITSNIVYGTFFMALIEFVVAAIGLYVLGVKFFFLLAVLVFFFAFIPAIGPAFVWIPLLIYYLIIGNYYVAVGLLVLGFVLSFVVDTVLRAKVLGEKSKINPLLMIVGILGGIEVFGIFGFIIGPLVLLYTLEILQAVFRD